jgi:DNA-binding NarL/FixJ family response regulator
MSDPITVLIADDHPIFRRGLREVIESERRLRLIAQVEDGEAAWDAIQREAPRVAVLDVDMPRRDGLAVARAVKDARLNVAIVLLTMHRNEKLFNAALDLGVEGYVLKDSAATEIVNAITATATSRRC